MTIPTSEDKVILIPLDLNSTSSPIYKTNKHFYTSDIGTAFLGFTSDRDLTDLEVILSLHDYSGTLKVQHVITEKTLGTTVYYPIPANELAHSGRWMGQITVREGEKVLTNTSFIFSVRGNINDGETEILVDYYNLGILEQQLTALSADLAASEAVREALHQEVLEKFATGQFLDQSRAIALAVVLG